MLCIQVKPDHATPPSIPKRKWQKKMLSLPSTAIRSPSWLPFAWNQSTEHKDHHDMTGHNNMLPNVFDALSSTNASSGEHNLMEVDPNGPTQPEAGLPDASNPLISSVTNVGTEEQCNGTSDGQVF